MDSTYPLFPIAAFLGFSLVLVPLPWHLKAWNSGTCFYMMWASLACFNLFVNSIIWHGNSVNWAPIWCDISIRIMMGASVGLPAASLCINRRLYYIITTKGVTLSPREKICAIMVDTSICVVFPLLYIALQYIIQGHRFDIYEDIGCFPAMYNTLPFYFLSCIWPLVIGCISAVYCVLTLHTFSQRRLEFTSMMASQPSITIWRYFRLMALAMTELMCTIPLSVIVIWVNATATPIQPWISWEDTHYHFDRVDQIPSIFWRRNNLLAAVMEFNRWVVPFSAFMFIIFFVFAEEARNKYTKVFSSIRSSSLLHLKFQKTDAQKSSGSLSSLPLPVASK